MHNCLAFKNCPSDDYSLSQDVQIRTISEVCPYCKAVKFNGKTMEICKGSDVAVFGLLAKISNINEVVQYQAGRYISSNEAVWRILSFPIHERSSLSGTFIDFSSIWECLHRIVLLLFLHVQNWIVNKVKTRLIYCHMQKQIFLS